MGVNHFLTGDRDLYQVKFEITGWQFLNYVFTEKKQDTQAIRSNQINGSRNFAYSQ
jgi:hypothetical protein